MSAPPPTIGVAMIGQGFMGRAHSHAWRNVAAIFDLPSGPAMTVICGRDGDALAHARRRWGWRDATTDWREAIEHPDVALVDICTPGSSHAEIAIAALAAGKHVLCEKPMANSLEQAREMAAAAASARAAGRVAMVAFNYRCVPAIALARELVAAGRLGEIRHLRACYLQDWLVDPAFPLNWRLDRAVAGSGALGDLGSHITDLAHHLLDDDITTVTGLLETFVPERPPAADEPALPGATTPLRRVSVDDATLFLARFARGAIGTFEATRMANGRKNALTLELNGTRGSLRFDLERLNELELFESDRGQDAGFSRILVTQADHPWIGAWWPPGHTLGWSDTFIHQAQVLLRAIAEGRQPSPSFDDGLRVARVLDAAARADGAGDWQTV
jgi:predicted dehydrogenase